MSLLSPENTLKQIKDSRWIGDLAKELRFDDDNIDKLVQLWKTIQFIKWDSLDGETLKFWVQVAKYENSAGNNTFQELANLAIAILSLPHSNAEVERLFSAMNTVKNKLRNKLAVLTLNSIPMIKNQMKIKNKTCYSYELPADVIAKVAKPVKKVADDGSSISLTASSLAEETIEADEVIFDFDLDF